MNTRTFKVLKNVRISLKNGVATMGDTVNSGDVVMPQCLPGMLKNKEIEVCEDGKTQISNIGKEPEKPKASTTKSTKKTTKKASKKPKDSE